MKQQDRNQKERERENEQESLYRFNAVTQKVKPENQNQGHNVKTEGFIPDNKRK
jgi:hypothetical protein